MTRTARPTDAGFTLTEMLVALFILSMLAVAGASLLLRATETGKQVRDREAEIRVLDIAQAFIRDDLEAATLRATALDQGFGDPQTFVGGQTNRTDALIRFVRNGWINPDGAADRSGLQTVRYILSEDGDLIREAVLRPDATNSTPVARRTLLKAVSTVDIGFWRGGDLSAYWEGTPQPPGNVLPDLVELRIRFEDGRTLTVASLVGGASS